MWLSDPTPLVYDCTSLKPTPPAVKLWQRVCQHTASRHRPYRPAHLLSWGESQARRPNVQRLMRRLGNRTVWVLGDSHALDLWCALTCVVLQASVTSEIMRANVTSVMQRTQTQMLIVTRSQPVQRAAAAGRRADGSTAIHEVRWRVPTCAYSRGGKCGVGTHCGTLGRIACGLGCGHTLLPRPGLDNPVVVLYSPCPSYASAPIMGVIEKALETEEAANLSKFLALPYPPLKSLCERHTATGNCSSHAFALKRRIDTYSDTSRAAAHYLRQLRDQSGGRSLGVLLQSPTAHFPELDGWVDPWTATRIDSQGSYERLLASSVTWLHAHLQNGGQQAVQVMGALGFWSAQPTTYRGELHRFEPSLALGMNWRERTQPCGRASHEATRSASAFECALQILRGLPSGEAAVLRAVRANTCRSGPFESDGHVSPREAGLPTPSAANWRQQVELDAAQMVGVPIIDTWAARASRWDLHPAIQGGPNASLGRLKNRYDCAHSSLSPGAFDAEVAALIRALDWEAGAAELHKAS